MEDAKILVKTVARAFYETEHIVVIDALVTHAALSSPDISLAMHLGNTNSNKIVQRLIGKLREGGLVSVFTRQEIREGANKPVAKEYYYIDYRRAIDSIKFRVHTVHEKIKAATSSTGQEERKEYVCPRCKSEYTAIDVLDSMDGAGNFLCKRCGHFLTELDEDMIQQDDTTALFNKQFGAILKLLQKLEEDPVPETTGEQALAEMRPMPRDSTNQVAKTQVVEAPSARPTAVKGMTNAPEKIEVAITSESESTAAQQAADAERKARIAAQNQLPEWHTRSTVTDEPYKPSGPTSAAPAPATANGGDKEPDRKEDGANLDDVFAMLAKEEAERKLKAEQEEEEDDDDDDDEFEEVAVKPANGADTPSVNHGGAGSASLTNGTTSVPEVKIEAPPLDSPNSSAAMKTEVSTPAGAMDTPKESDEDDDDFEEVQPPPTSSLPIKRSLEMVNGESPEAKKAKLEQRPASAPDGRAGEESDEDVDEFEDV